MTIADRLKELEASHSLACKISNDSFGNARIAALKQLVHSAKSHTVKVQWEIYTVNSSGENIEAKNIINPYTSYQAATDGVRVDPLTGQRTEFVATDLSGKTRAELEIEATDRSVKFDSNTTDEDLIELIVKEDLFDYNQDTATQYEYFTSAIQSKQAHYYDLLQGFLMIDDTKGLI